MPYRSIGDADQLRKLLDAVLLVGADLSLPAVLHRIVESARSLVDAAYAALGVLDESGKGLAEFITVGLEAESERAIGQPPEGHGILGLLISEPKPIRLPDLSRHPDSHGFPPHHPPMRSFLGFPIRVRGEIFGNLYLTDKIGAEEFSEEDEAAVVALSVAAGVAIENARLHARVRDLALLEDRERIARDLHDTVIQRLFATGLALQGTARLATETGVRTRLQESVDDLDTTIRQIRSTIFALETVGTDEHGLRADVLALCRELAPTLSFDPQVHFSGALDAHVSGAVHEHLLATLREALTNVARHAHATRAEVEVEAEGDSVVLRVTDNGTGMPSTLRAEGHGVKNMGQRAASLGGALRVETLAAGGTRLEWRVPARANTRAS